MAKTNREEEILQLIRRKGFMTIEALAQQFDVTPQTIRRDITRLVDDEQLHRYHGGAGLPPTAENPPHSTRKVKNQLEKQALAKKLAEHIPSHSSLLIHVGTTNEEVAKALVHHQELKIITNSIHIANILSQRTDFEVILAGGVVRNQDGGIIGEATMDFIRQFRVDYGIIAVSGIERDGTLLDFDYREVRVAQVVMECSRRVFVAADHSKFERNAMIRMGEIQQVDAFFTDRVPSEVFQEVLRNAEVELHVADPTVDGASSEADEALNNATSSPYGVV